MSAFRTTLPPPLRADVLYEWSLNQNNVRDVFTVLNGRPVLYPNGRDWVA